MIATPQYVTNNEGKKKSVILPIKDYEYLLEKKEELEDIILYYEAKLEDDGEYILFEDHLKSRKKNV